MTTFWNDAPTLWANGWRGLIPIRSGEKQPCFQKWQLFANGEQTREDLTSLAKRAGQRAGVGMVGGNGATVVDIDVLDPHAAAFALGVAEEELGVTPLHVIGKAPKRKLIYRGGIRSGKQANPGGLALEIFHGLPSETNGQTVLFGIHPDTERAYSWPIASPLTVALADVPAIDGEGLERVISRLAGAFGQYPALRAAVGVRDPSAQGGIATDITGAVWRHMNAAGNGEGIEAAVELLGRLLAGSRHGGMVVLVRILIAEWMMPPRVVFEGLADAWSALVGPERFGELERAIRWSLDTRPPEYPITLIGKATPADADPSPITFTPDTGRAAPRRRRSDQ